MNLYRTAQESGKNARSVLPKTAKWAKPEKIAVKQGQSGAQEVLFFSGFLTHIIAQFSRLSHIGPFWRSYGIYDS
jgi:hypothetical protein